MLTDIPCSKCGGECIELDDQYGRWWRDCMECGYNELTSGELEKDGEPDCYVCDDVGYANCDSDIRGFSVKHS
jgi:hypothetical protein